MNGFRIWSIENGDICSFQSRLVFLGVSVALSNFHFIS